MNFKKFNSLQCFFKLRTNLRKHTKHVCNIPHKKVSKRRSTAENFLSHMLKIEINFLIKIDDNFKIEKRLFLVLQKISQYSQENIHLKGRPALLKRDSDTSAFLYILRNF